MGHIAGAVRRQTPLTAKVALIAAFRISRNDGNEQAAVVDLLADPVVPGVAARSSLLSNQTSMPALRRAVAIRSAAAASSEA